MPEFKGTDMIDQAVFEECWEWFKDKFAHSDKDLLHGYMILKAQCAILEEAFGFDSVEAVVDRGGDDESDKV